MMEADRQDLLEGTLLYGRVETLGYIVHLSELSDIVLA
jgi:hypothetical protein